MEITNFESFEDLTNIPDSMLIDSDTEIARLTLDDSVEMENFEKKKKKFMKKFDGHADRYGRFLLVGRIDMHMRMVMECLEDMGILDACGNARECLHDNGECSIYFEGSKVIPLEIYEMTKKLSCRGFADDWDGNYFLAVSSGDDYTNYQMEITDDFRDNNEEEEVPTYDVRFKLIDTETGAVFYGGGGCLSSETREEYLCYAKGHPVVKTNDCNSPYPGIKNLYSEEIQDFEDAAGNFKAMLYEFYCLIWEKDHPCNREQLIFDFHMSAFGQEYETLEDYIEDVGLDGHGNSPASYEEWLDNEYKDEENIAELLKRVHQVGLFNEYIHVRKREASSLANTHIDTLIRMRDTIHEDDEEMVEALNFALDAISKKI